MMFPQERVPTFLANKKEQEIFRHRGLPWKKWMTKINLSRINWRNVKSICMKKLFWSKWLGRNVLKLQMREYKFPYQVQEFISDMFDISLSHKIIACIPPGKLYVVESEQGDTNIDSNLIESISEMELAT